uniref:Uncharacterized protein n=1 Tax=Amphimedon queenslandica TaxID=400682 RepID=A0A1X7SXP6_AMPQE
MILKKHDKLASSDCGNKFYKENVEILYFYELKEINTLIQRIKVYIRSIVPYHGPLTLVPVAGSLVRSLFLYYDVSFPDFWILSYLAIVLLDMRYFICYPVYGQNASYQ